MINRKHSTKDYITIALYYLMSKYDYDSITVTDICSKARVSRMSFYRYFNNKEDIFINYCDERFEEFFTSIRQKNDLNISIGSNPSSNPKSAKLNPPLSY